MAPRGEDRPLQCCFCAKTFARSSHRKRHELIHAADRQHRCAICSKSFGRRDALQRHEQAHQTSPRDAPRRRGRACCACAVAKARCDGGRPCTRCDQRGSVCADAGDETAQGPHLWQSVATPLPLVPPAPPHFHHPVIQMPSGIDAAEIPSATWPNFEDGQPHFAWDPSILASTNWYETVSLGGSGLTNHDDALQLQDGLIALSASLEEPHPGIPVGVPPALAGPPHLEGMQPGLGCDDLSLTPGAAYVDGEHARLPNTKSRTTRPRIRGFLQPPVIEYSVHEPPHSSHANAVEVSIEPEQYEILLAHYQRLCLVPSPIWKAFREAPFPSKSFFEGLMSLYFEHFSSTCPFLHSSCLADGAFNWMLVLAIASIGARYIEAEYKQSFVLSLQEFQRRLMISIEEDASLEKSLQHDSAAFLYSVGMLYCGNGRLSDISKSERQASLRDTYFRARQRINGASPATTQVFDDVTWHNWRDQESAIRLAYCAWLFDCMQSYQQGIRPLLGSSEAQIPLPCHEKLWDAKTWDTWLIAAHEEPALLEQSPTLVKATQEIYIEKKLPRGRGEFARVLIIHALFHRLREVEQYFVNPLSQWEPVAISQDCNAMLANDAWLPANDTFAKWQNSTCDVLDILHWQANAKVGQANGFEHPTVLHLHAARIVLLTPHQDIVRLSRLLTASDGQDTGGHASESMEAMTKSIRRWAVQHQYKARLSVVHAGAVFWHLRRYPLYAPHEPSAVFLASLVLWAFGVFASASTLGHAKKSLEERRASTSTFGSRAERSEHAEDSIETCEVILLDRPTDDELVQAFIRRGDSMEAHLGGVGNLYQPESPELALLQGCKILEQSETVWGVASQQKTLLADLSARWQRQRMINRGM